MRCAVAVLGGKNPDNPCLMTFLAIDIGNTSAGPTGDIIGSAVFTGENVPGVTVGFENRINPWFAPNFGSTPQDNMLERIMGSIAWDSNGNATYPGLGIDLQVGVGAPYKLQLLFSDLSSVNFRCFDIEIEGVNVLNEMDVAALMSAWSGQPDSGVVFTYEFIAQDSVLNILLRNGTSLGNRDPILNALTLETIPEPATLALLGLGVLGFARRRRGGK